MRNAPRIFSGETSEEENTWNRSYIKIDFRQIECEFTGQTELDYGRFHSLRSLQAVEFLSRQSK